MEPPGRDAEQIATDIGRIRAQIKRLRNQEQISQANLREMEELSGRESQLSRQLVDAMVERVTASSSKESKKTTSPRLVSPSHKSPTKPSAATGTQKKPGTKHADKRVANVERVLRLHLAEHPVAKQLLLEKPSRLRPFVTFLRLGLKLTKFTDFDVIRAELQKSPWLLTEFRHLLDGLHKGSPLTESNIRQLCQKLTRSHQWKGDRDDKAFENEYCSEFPLSPPLPPLDEAYVNSMLNSSFDQLSDSTSDSFFK